MKHVILFCGVILAGVCAVAALLYVIVSSLVPIAVPTATPVYNPIPTSTVPVIVPTDVPDPTPTQEFSCVPNSYAMVMQMTPIFFDPEMTTDKGTVKGGEFVLLLLGETEHSREIVTAGGPRIQGWIPKCVLPENCR